MVKNIIRDKKHLNFIRTLECVMCANPFVVAAHLRIGTDGGTSLKPSDSWVTPLCDPCHRYQHNKGERTFWKETNPHQLCRDLYAATGNYVEAMDVIEQWRNENARRK